MSKASLLEFYEALAVNAKHAQRLQQQQQQRQGARSHGGAEHDDGFGPDSRTGGKGLLYQARAEHNDGAGEAGGGGRGKVSQLAASTSSIVDYYTEGKYDGNDLEREDLTGDSELFRLEEARVRGNGSPTFTSGRRGSNISAMSMSIAGVGGVGGGGGGRSRGGSIVSLVELEDPVAAKESARVMRALDAYNEEFVAPVTSAGSSHRPPLASSNDKISAFSSPTNRRLSGSSLPSLRPHNVAHSPSVSPAASKGKSLHPNSTSPASPDYSRRKNLQGSQAGEPDTSESDEISHVSPTAEGQAAGESLPFYSSTAGIGFDSDEAEEPLEHQEHQERQDSEDNQRVGYDADVGVEFNGSSSLTLDGAGSKVFDDFPSESNPNTYNNTTTSGSSGGVHSAGAAGIVYRAASIGLPSSSVDRKHSLAEGLVRVQGSAIPFGYVAPVALSPTDAAKGLAKASKDLPRISGPALSFVESGESYNGEYAASALLKEAQEKEKAARLNNRGMAPFGYAGDEESEDIDDDDEEHETSSQSNRSSSGSDVDEDEDDEELDEISRAIASAGESPFLDKKKNNKKKSSRSARAVEDDGSTTEFISSSAQGNYASGSSISNRSFSGGTGTKNGDGASGSAVKITAKMLEEQAEAARAMREAAQAAAPRVFVAGDGTRHRSLKQSLAADGLVPVQGPAISYRQRQTGARAPAGSASASVSAGVGSITNGGMYYLSSSQASSSVGGDDFLGFGAGAAATAVAGASRRSSITSIASGDFAKGAAVDRTAQSLQQLGFGAQGGSVSSSYKDAYSVQQQGSLRASRITSPPTDRGKMTQSYYSSPPPVSHAAPPVSSSKYGYLDQNGTYSQNNRKS
jgi:hypothetical protein